jgi:hypothetical protein
MTDLLTGAAIFAAFLVCGLLTGLTAVTIRAFFFPTPLDLSVFNYGE